MINTNIIRQGIITKKELVPLVPLMTSNSAPFGTALANYQGIFQAWCGFATSQYWQSQNGVFPSWIQYQSTSSVKPIAYTWNSSVSADLTHAWHYSGSNDGVNWNGLDSRDQIVPFPTNNPTYIIPNTGSYIYHRLTFVAAQNNSVAVNNIQFFY